MDTIGNRDYYEIVAGPNKDLIFDSCKYAYDDVNLYANFVVAVAYTVPKGAAGRAYIPMAFSEGIVTEIDHEDGTGEKLKLKGYCRVDTKAIAEKDVVLRARGFEAYYNTRTRKGTITFV